MVNATTDDVTMDSLDALIKKKRPDEPSRHLPAQS